MINGQPVIPVPSGGGQLCVAQHEQEWRAHYARPEPEMVRSLEV